MPPRALHNAADVRGAEHTNIEPVGVGLLTARDLALVEAVALRVLDLLGERRTPRLVGAQQLAGILGVARSTVYEHAADLGAVEVGGGTRPRLRFDVDRALAAWTVRCSSEQSHEPKQPAPTGGSRRRRPDRLGSGVPLLPGALHGSDLGKSRQQRKR
jgi:hypothetical protein